MFTANEIPDLSGKTMLVTGANSGLGLETTRALAAKGAHVVMACRNPRKADSAVDDIRRTVPNASLVVRALDLASLESINAFVKEVRFAHPKLDALINNAGIMAIPRRLTADGFEMQLGTNHLGHFALTLGLLPSVEAAHGRVVVVASTAHKFGKMRFDDLMGAKKYSAWGAYGQSKLANLLFCFELERRLRAAGKSTIALAAHPGYSATNLVNVGPQMTGSGFTQSLMNLGAATLAQSSAQGALPTLYAATMPDAKGGEYFGPDGLFELRGAPVRVQGNARAQNQADATTLWEQSLTLTHAAWPF